MHSFLGKRGAVLVGLLALMLTASVPSVASAGPEPGAKGRGFRLFARSLGALTINRIYCGLATTGEICVDSLNSSTIGGGYWPKGTPDQYIFNSGLQIAGVIGPDGGPWADDTTGAFFFDPKGTTAHGEEVQPIYNSANPADLAAWPQAAYVRGDLFDPLLQGRPIASQGDIWFMTWDGNPGLNAGRPHPLGVLVETRGMGWNFPSGNEDILYFIYTFYNITTTNPAAYAAYDPALQEILLGKAADFQSLNEQSFNVTLPDEGYTITDMYAAFASDNDVADAGANHSSVNLPFALGYTYEHSFGRQESLGWIFPADIFGAPFFPGAGFIGMKYLKSPTGPGEIQLYSNTENGGDFGDPRDAAQLFRYLSGNISEAAGDEACNVSDPRVCYVNQDEGDTRFFQSSTALELAPGASGTIVVAYIMAAPVAVPGYVQGTELQPGDVLATATPADLTANNVPLVDRLTGFVGWEDDNEDGIPQQAEFDVVPRSLLGKSLTAQAVFDGGFLLPFAPETPEFFLVPGDNEVTVLWRQSNSEVTGDPYFALASQPTVFDEVLGADVPNALYDPNYRQFDVEGYRVYRGRVDAPGDLELIAQFDYAGTEIIDYYGRINPTPLCAPELGIVEDCGDVEAPVPGMAPTVGGEAYPLAGEIVQIGPGGRVGLADSSALVVVADTLLGTTGSCGPRSTCPDLDDTGVPFVYVDSDVRNGFRYFYSVTAFDVNSLTSGPTNLESPRVTKVVTPRPTATNFANEAELTIEILGGDGVPITNTTMPTIDPATGTFSGPFPPSREGLELSLAAFAGQVIAGSGGFSAKLDSIRLGSAATDAGGTTPTLYHYTLTTADGASTVTIPITQSYTSGIVRSAATFPAVPIDPELASLYGGGDGFVIPGQAEQTVPGAYYTNIHGRGCINHAAGFQTADDEQCDYNGARWFSGANETFADPTAGNLANSSFPQKSGNFNNAGAVDGAVTVYEGRAYYTLPYWWRLPAAQLGGAVRASDIQFTWGEGGTMASVRDLTYNVDVPFDTAGGGGWGFMNFDAQNVAGLGDLYEDHVSLMDVYCTAQLATGGAQVNFLDVCPQIINLSNTAVPGPVAYLAGGVSGLGGSLPIFGLGPNDVIGLHPAANDGLVLYVAGHIFTFELEGGALPAAGTVWTMRSHGGGVINGGNDGLAGDEGPYSYVQQQLLPFTAVGATVNFAFDVQNEVVAATEADVANVHTVPDPYYVTNAFEQSTDNKIIQFVNLPQRAIIRIYSASGVLVDAIEHESAQQGGAASWNLRNRNNQVVASGVYFFHVESGDARKIGKFTVVNFAQ